MSMDFDKPVAEHEWLHKLVGEWTMESKMGEDGCGSGRETVRSVGPMWVQCTGRAEMPGGGPEGEMVLTIGYDLALKKYVGTWYGSMMSRLWVYDIERQGEELVMSSEGPAMEGEGTARYRDVITWKDADTREFAGWVQKPDGTWNRFMHATYRRVK